MKVEATDVAARPQGTQQNIHRGQLACSIQDLATAIGTFADFGWWQSLIIMLDISETPPTAQHIYSNVYK